MPATMRSALVAHSRRCFGALAAPALEQRAGEPAHQRGLAGATRSDEQQVRQLLAIEQRNERIEHRIDADRRRQPARAHQLDPVLGDSLERRRGRALVGGLRPCGHRRLDRAPLDDLLVELAPQVVERRGVVADERREHERADRVRHGARGPRRRTTSRTAARSRDRATHRRAWRRRSRAGSARSRRRSRSRADRGGPGGCRPRCGGARAPRSTGSARRCRCPR